jgi:hypothetical protein
MSFAIVWRMRRATVKTGNDWSIASQELQEPWQVSSGGIRYCGADRKNPDRAGIRQRPPATGQKELPRAI